MERRIKTLYIITIIAIIAFLGLQTYWLFGRYEYAMMDYERELSEKVIRGVNEYSKIRDKASQDLRAEAWRNKSSILTVPSFSLSQQYGDSVRTKRTARIMTYIYSSYELLGIAPGTPLTDEQKKKAIELAQQQMKEPTDSAVFDASGAKDENEAWLATKNVQIERKYPFTVEGIDSVLKVSGIKADITLDRVDSTVWNTATRYRLSLLAPALDMTIPYSQLEGRRVNIVCRIDPFDVLPGMWHTLVISLLVSGLLIVCLLSQFSTVLKLSRLDKMRNSFITTMIHELKRPISTLKMCVSGIENEKMMSDPGIRGELLGETRRALDNLSSYFSRLRDITFNDVEQIPLNIQRINLHELFDEAVASLTMPGGKKTVIGNDIDDDAVVSADRSHLFNIVTNLVENAVKYSGQSVEIHARAVDDESGFVEIRISDNGNGISPTDIRHIFDRFYRGGASSGDIPGMGLGLTYVKLLVDAHGGDIAVDSRVGEGTCFIIRLPR